ncbi:circadian clock KaiB family protein [Ferruginibacter albus]|uniref:circadian clock KaiB family protein n=1 Tax=Ferruginibacter albus TaxID=2875540 RepID=UPI001CC7943A|nr:circadian clock KaiB family protein [Ferruginibacter albus]UAY50821.1 circadian clock KaiB family protein [Ferruginibacter albus]
MGKISASSNPKPYLFRLYITGASPNSVKAISNLKSICELYIKDKYELEIIDVYQQPLIAKAEQLIALPLLVKLSPLPLKKLIGNMSDTKKVLDGLELNSSTI